MYLKPKELFEKANALANSGDYSKLDEALRASAALLQHLPDDASTLALTGKIMALKQYYGIARQLTYRAIELLKDDEKFNFNRAEYYNNIGFCCRYLNLSEEGRECYRKALELTHGKEADIYGNLAAMYVARGDAIDGLQYADKALEAAPDDLSAQNNKSIMLLELGRWEEGFGLYDARMCLKEEGQQWRNYPGDVPLWDGTKGKRVVVYGEQGIGDEVMFASMLPDIMKDCEVVFDCHDRLYDLFKASFPDLKIYGTKRKDPKDLEWWGKHKIDAKIPIGSLAKFYRKKDGDFPKTPYLTSHDEEITQRVKSLGNRPKIGFSWMGGRIDTHCWQRHIPLWLWEDIFSLDADFISLQYDKEAEEVLKEHCGKTGHNLHHWADIVCDPDYNKTAALVSNLDMVISVPQSVVHLSGALGVPTMQLTPKHAMWQMGVYGKDMPWYGCVKSYWQETPDDWQPVLDKAALDLITLIGTA
jgi:tetratricopeptide (TPR) repeat protein